MESDNLAGMYSGATATAATESLMNNRAQFTLMGWFNPFSWPQTTPGGSARVALFGQNDAAEFGFHGANTVGIWTPNGGYVSFDATTLITPGNWYFITATGNGTNITFYLNGNQAATGGNATTNYGSSGSPFRIGYGVLDTEANEFQGYIDEVVFFDRALSMAEVNEIYGKAVGVPEPPQHPRGADGRHALCHPRQDLLGGCGRHAAPELSVAPQRHPDRQRHDYRALAHQPGRGAGR
jgi:hypothetical protein